MPLQRCPLPLPTPLEPLWTVLPVQSLSACTTKHFTSSYTSTSPMDRTACTERHCLYKCVLYLFLYRCNPYRPYNLYRASVPVQRSTLTLPIPLLPLWALQPVQSLSVCTSLHLTFSLSLYQYGNNTAKGKAEIFERNPVPLSLIPHKIFQVGRSEIEPGTLRHM